MNFIYLDPGLFSYIGHHASFCRHLTESLRNRGHHVSIYANHYMSPDLRRDLNLQPLFRANPYNRYLPEHETQLDPICGWLKAFETAWQATLEDLTFLKTPDPDDVIYWNSAFPGQLVALVHWLKRFPKGAAPKAIVELNLDSGVIVTHDHEGHEQFEVPDPRVQERPLLWRYAGMLLVAPEIRERVKLINFEPSTIPGYEFLMRRPVEACTPPFGAAPKAISRVGKRAFAIGILGQQREEKGYALVPALARELLAARQDIAILVHNSDPQHMVETQTEMRQLAKEQNRLVLREGPLTPKTWAEMLAACDVVVCPYDPVAFRTRCSGMLNESLAYAAPVVVPAATSLAQMFDEFGRPGTTFEKWEPDSIARAVHSALDNYDEHAQKAFDASVKWRQEHSVDTLAEKIIAWARETPVAEARAAG